LIPSDEIFTAKIQKIVAAEGRRDLKRVSHTSLDQYSLFIPIFVAYFSD
jgi:hypothetical protein